MKSYLVSFMALAILLMPFLTYAGDKPEAQAELEEVVVTASKVEEIKKEVTTNIQVISEKEISLSSADNLGDLLAEKGIGHIHKYPGCSTSVGIRGFRTDTGSNLKGRVLILLNGRRAGTGNLAKIMTKNIERIEIIRGPASVQYGSSAIGGLINVITKEGEGKPSAFAEGKLGSFDYEEGSVGGSGEIKGFDFSGSYSRSTQDDYDTAEGDEYHNTGFDEKEHASLNLGYEFLPGNRIGLIYTSFDADEVGSPYYLSQNDLDDYTDQSNESIDFIYDGSLPGGPWSWKARYFTGEDEYRWYDPTINYKFDRDIDNKGAQAQVTFNPGKYRLTTGVDWVNYEIENSSGADNEYDNPAYFLMGKASFMDRSLFLKAGLRYDQYDLDSKKGKGGDEDDHNWTPHVGLSYLPMDNLKFRINYSQGFKMPNADQLAADYTYYGIPYKGNPDLDPEESDTCEVGMDFYYQTLNTSLTYFYTDFDDKIEQRTKGSFPNTWKTWENVGEATISGLEGSFSYDIGSLFDWQWSLIPYGNFVWLTEFEDEETDQDLLYTSDLNCSWGLRVLDNNKGLSADLNFAYTGEQDIEYYDPTTYQTTRMQKGGFTVANLTVQKRILDFHRFGSITLKGEIRNLLDKDYAYVKGYPMPGRSFFLGMRYEWGQS